jgi:hypothetical protein
MYKKLRKPSLLAALTILLCLSVCGCAKSTGSAGNAPFYGQTSAKAPAKTTVKSITLTIDARKGDDGVVANGKKVTIKAGSTVYAVLKSYCAGHKLLLAAQKTGNGIYVSSIDGVAQFDFGSGSGWIYSVGGVFPQKDCNSYKLKGGEKVRWVYTTDLGKSEGASK